MKRGRGVEPKLKPRGELCLSSGDLEISLSSPCAGCGKVSENYDLDNVDPVQIQVIQN